MSQTSPTMSAGLSRYKLQTEFYPNTVVHTTHKSDLNRGLRKRLFKATWRRHNELGSGAFGVVWSEVNTATKDWRAVKIISKACFKDFRELDALAELQDRPELFILFYGWFEDVHSIYIAMEFIEEGDLSQYIRRNKEEARAEAKEIASQVLEGLAVMHARGICHRDLKPQNILIASVSPIWVKISDFGISKRTTGTDLRTSCGTAWYKAPEQQGLLPRHMRTGDSYTTAVDLWAFGAVIHQVLTSAIPFLETYLDTDSMAITDFIPQLDMKLLFGYCNGSESFPVERLEANMVDEEGIDFVKSLMAVNPDNRVSAIDASCSPWLTGTNHSEPDVTTVGTLVSSPQLLQTQFQLLDISLSDQDANRLYVEEDQAKITDILKFSPDSRWPYVAASRGYIEITKILLKLVNFRHRSFGDRLVSAAAGAGQVTVLELLLNHGADISPTTYNGWPLAEAALGGHLDAMRLLISRGAAVDRDAPRDEFVTPLQAASRGGHLAAISMLLHEGANSNASPVKGGLTALQEAASGGHVDAMGLLICDDAIHEAPARFGGRSALQAAASGGHVAAIHYLLLCNADINGSPALDSGRTPLQAAAERGHLKAVELLCLRGASIDLGPAFEHGRTALQAAAGGGHLDVVEFLLEQGANLNEEPGINYGRTSLQAAAGGGHIDVVKFLIEKHDANVNQAAGINYGRTALQAAAGGGHLEVVEFLLENEADVGGDTGIKYGRTALQAAAECGNLDIIQLLLDNGADVGEDPADEYGITAFQAAVLGAHVDAMELLLSREGVDIDQAFGKKCAHLHNTSWIKGKPWSPVEFAVVNNNRAMVKLLVDHQAQVSKRILKEAQFKPLILKTLRRVI